MTRGLGFDSHQFLGCVEDLLVAEEHEAGGQHRLDELGFEAFHED